MKNMAVQKSYGFGFAKGVSGGLFDLSNHEVATRQAEGSVKFGLGTVAGTNGGVDVKLPDSTSTAADFEGVAVHNSVMVELDMNNGLDVGDKKTVGCLTKGRIWVPLAPGAEPEYKGVAYLVKDGAYAGYFTSVAEAYNEHTQCESSDSGALHIVADSATPSSGEIKISEVHPVAGFVPSVGDYVKAAQVYGAGLDVGATFYNAADSANGIAVITLN